MFSGLPSTHHTVLQEKPSSGTPRSQTSVSCYRWATQAQVFGIRLPIGLDIGNGWFHSKPFAEAEKNGHPHRPMFPRLPRNVLFAKHITVDEMSYFMKNCFLQVVRDASFNPVCSLDPLLHIICLNKNL